MNNYKGTVQKITKTTAPTILIKRILVSAVNRKETKTSTVAKIPVNPLIVPLSLSTDLLIHFL